MLTIEKATQLLNIAFNEYPSLKDEEINIKYGEQFEVESTAFDNMINIYLKNDPEGELIRVNKDDEASEEYILINI